MTKAPSALSALAVTSILLTSALVVAGCGGSSSPAVAHLSSAKGASPASSESAASAQQRAVAYARCMRSHGVPDFPEPVEGHFVLKGGLGSGQNQGSAAGLEAAEHACRKLQPNGGTASVSPEMQKQAEERALEFAACMRSHGEPHFPEPEFSSSGGGFHITISGPNSGIDLNSPQFKSARMACRRYFGPPGSRGEPEAAPSNGEPNDQAVAP